MDLTTGTDADAVAFAKKNLQVIGTGGWQIGVLVILALAATAADAWTAMGRRAEGSRRARMERSPQWKDGHFENPPPLVE